VEFELAEVVDLEEVVELRLVELRIVELRLVELRPVEVRLTLTMVGEAITTTVLSTVVDETSHEVPKLLLELLTRTCTPLTNCCPIPNRDHRRRDG
jgi:hypothetical protein